MSQTGAAPGRPRREVPRPARPRRLRRGGGEWSSEGIADALRSWTHEPGRAPRSYDWSPAVARAGGFSLAGVEKWEREFPRWPHHALVRARFGSWRAALRAAGLPGPAPLVIARRERVQTAQRLQGRLTSDELADLLGVNPRTVRDYWRAGVCARCGGPQIRPEAASCADCIPFAALRRPSRTEIVRALRRWQRETGAAPRLADWREPGGKWESEYPAWPSAGDVRARFGSWPAALAHAGLRPHRRTWTRAAVVCALQAWAAQHGRPPQHRDWQAAGVGHPTASTVANVFGGWTAALDAAGLPTSRRAWTAPEILEGLRAFEQAHGRPPTSGDLRDTRGTPYPPASAVARSFGSFGAGLAQLDWGAARTPVADAEILAALAAYAVEHGRPPACAVWRREHRQPAASVIIRRYGAWSAALAAAAGAERSADAPSD